MYKLMSLESIDSELFGYIGHEMTCDEYFVTNWEMAAELIGWHYAGNGNVAIDMDKLTQVGESNIPELIETLRLLVELETSHYITFSQMLFSQPDDSMVDEWDEPGMIEHMVSEATKGLSYFGITEYEEGLLVPKGLDIMDAMETVSIYGQYVEHVNCDPMPNDQSPAANYYRHCKLSGDDDTFDYCGTYVNAILASLYGILCE